MSANMKTGTGDFDPNSLKGQYSWVESFSLEKSPKDQGFLIHTKGVTMPIFGIVADSELPLVDMRRSVMGETVRRYLQVPGGEHNGEGVRVPVSDDTLATMELYYRSVRGDVMKPSELRAPETAHFVPVDADGEVLLQDGRILGIYSVGVVAVELALPLLEGVPEQYGDYAYQFEHLVGSEQ